MLKLFLLLAPIYLFAYPVSDHYDGKKFHNLENREMKSFWDVMVWKFSGGKRDWPESVLNKNYPFLKLSPENQAVVTFLNHASFLIQLPQLTILTDPIFSERASPYRFVGPKRVRPPGMKLEELPAVDVVLISHNHYDHLDIESLVQLDAKFHPLFLVPLGDERLLKERGIQNVKELDWWQKVDLKEVVFHFTPTQHWSARGLFDKCDSLWGGFFIHAPSTKIYFGGDSGYAGHYKLTREKLGAPDLALLPIGAYAPRWLMKISHMNPEEAVTAHKDLGAHQSFGMHFGTFQLTDEGIDDPIKGLAEALVKFSVNPESFRVLDNGESFSF